MDETPLDGILSSVTLESHEDTEDLLEELMRAAEEHRRILERQSELIRRLREELKEVRG